jgi:rubrerythrin
MKIWNNYSILARIADAAGDKDAARRYRAQEREEFAAAPIAREHQIKFAPQITAVAAAAADPARRAEVEAILDQGIENGWAALVAALRAVLDGARDEAALCEPLNGEDAVVVRAVLQRLAGGAP